MATVVAAYSGAVTHAQCVKYADKRQKRNWAGQGPTQCSSDGAGNRNRTYDLRITNAPLYQLSYSG